MAAIQIKECFPKVTSLWLNHILYACKNLSLRTTVRVPRPLLYSCNLASNPFQPAEAKQLSLRCNITMQYRQSQGLNGTVEFRKQYYNAIHGDCLVLHLLFRIQLHAVLKTNRKLEYMYQTSGNCSLYNFLIKLLPQSPSAQYCHGLKDCHSHKFRV